MRRARVRPAASRGFTLIELMVVTVILATLIAVAVPRLGNAVRSANEGATKAKLGAMRSALTLYYTDSEGSYPADLSPILEPGSKYLTESFPIYTAAHGQTNDVAYVPAPDGADTGGWAYVTDGDQRGRVYVQCTHTDVKGNVWNQY